MTYLPMHSGTGKKQMNTGAVYCLNEHQPSKRKPACKIYTFNGYNRPPASRLASRSIKHHPQQHLLLTQQHSIISASVSAEDGRVRHDARQIISLE